MTRVLPASRVRTESVRASQANNRVQAAVSTLKRRANIVVGAAKSARKVPIATAVVAAALHRDAKFAAMRASIRKVTRHIAALVANPARPGKSAAGANVYPLVEQGKLNVQGVHVKSCNRTRRTVALVGKVVNRGNNATKAHAALSAVQVNQPAAIRALT